MKHASAYFKNDRHFPSKTTTPYEEITNKIVAAIEDGSASYVMPWHQAESQIPLNALTGKTYRGINILSLWAEALHRGFYLSKWATYKQWQELGYQVKKGEKSVPVVFWDSYTDTQSDEENPRAISFVKRYRVFNCTQVEDFVPDVHTPSSQKERIASAEAFFLNLGSDVRAGGNAAGYSKSGDFIRMPAIEQFHRTEGYYSVLGHEHVHWSGHEGRLNRDLSGRFGDSSYAMEELIAELGAAFLCAHLGVKTEPRTDHAGYIQTWLSVLRNDNRAIFTAASTAQKAVDYLIDESKRDPILVGQGLVDAAKRIFNLTAI